MTGPCCCCCCCCLAGVVITQMQALHKHRQGMSTVAVARQVYRDHGVAGFFKGLMPSMVMVSQWGCRVQQGGSVVFGYVCVSSSLMMVSEWGSSMHVSALCLCVLNRLSLRPHGGCSRMQVSQQQGNGRPGVS
jgi:hypothetical protein